MNIINGNKIFSFFTETKKGVAELSNNEIKASISFKEKRLIDFVTGRFCARKSIENLGLSNIEVLIGSDGMPLWPFDLVGSISHSETLTGAIIAYKTDYLSLGLDIEVIGNVTSDMWSYVFTESEKILLRSLGNPNKQMELSTILFSMKESFYKLQNPITNLYLDFLDIEIKSVLGEYYINVVYPINRHQKLCKETKMSFIKYNNVIITFCNWTNSPI
jgi:4'-phosphopantetheinyl transferase EntD